MCCNWHYKRYNYIYQNKITPKKTKMAYKQNPGRGNSPKTGNGIPSPFRQTSDEVLSAADKASKIVAGRKSNKGLDMENLNIERAAATDSILASHPKNEHLYTAREKQQMGNQAGNATRKINDARTVVTRSEGYDSKVGNKDIYKRELNK